MKVVLGYDGSDYAKRAVERAATLAGSDPVLVVSVVPSTGMNFHASGGGVESGAIQSHAELLREAERLLKERGATVELRETFQAPLGDTAEALIHVAEDSGATMIIVGRRGMNGLKRVVVGSVSEKLVRHAACDVLVIH